MLAPRLATMLVVLTTDAVARRGATWTRPCAPPPGSPSTGSTPTAACRPTTPWPCWRAAPPESRRRCRLHRGASPALRPTSPRSCIGDAEGASHDIAIEVRQAASEDDAVEVGRCIARNNLFKAAIFGNDPNWGRVLAAIGTTEAAFDPVRRRRRHERRLGLPRVHAGRGPATRRPHGPREVSVTVDLKVGDAPGDDLDQRPHARLRPREQRVLIMTTDETRPALEPAKAADAHRGAPVAQALPRARSSWSSTAATR